MSFGGSAKGKGKPPPWWHQFVLGAASGMLASAATHPFDLVKVRIQVHKTGEAGAAKEGIVRTFFRVLRTDGILGLYKGLGASLLRQATYTNARVGLYLNIKGFFENPDGSFPLWKKITCSVIAGMGGAWCGNPADMVMVRMQADGRLPPEQRRNYRGAFHAIYRVVREEGIVTLWAGSIPNIVRGGLMTAGQLASYDQIKEWMLRSLGFKDNEPTHFLASTGAAFIATVICTPLDVVKTRLMNMKKGEYKGVVDCFIKTVRNEGPMALYKGFVPFFVRLAPHTIITFVAFEKLRVLLLNLQAHIDARQ